MPTPRRIPRRIRAAAALLLALCAAACRAKGVTPALALETPGAFTLRLAIEPGFKVFADSVKVEFSAPESSGSPAPAFALAPRRAPEPEMLVFDSQTNAFYRGLVRMDFDLPPAHAQGRRIAVRWQACGEDLCYLPETAWFGAEASAQGAAMPACAPARTLSGYESTEKFLEFLEAPQSAGAESGGAWDPLGAAGRSGSAALILLAALAAGAALNLTPCALPLVPVNLAMIGRGARRGAAFGLGMAAVFGGAGLAAAAGGAAIGAVQSSAAFHAGAAALFCVLSLAMLGVVRVDFSGIARRFVRRKKPARRAGAAWALLGAFAGGGASAALSGACVAPALVAALALAAQMAAEGAAAGYALPFALGLGMGLPWPFLGAGLLKLPRAGRWSARVNQAFALAFVAMALRSLAVAWRIMNPSGGADGSAVDWTDAQSAFAARKPVLAYLTADWCGACRKYSETAFKDDRVLGALKAFSAVKIDCTDFNSPETRKWLSASRAIGIPHFAVFKNKSQAKK